MPIPLAFGGSIAHTTGVEVDRQRGDQRSRDHDG